MIFTCAFSALLVAQATSQSFSSSANEFSVYTTLVGDSIQFRVKVNEPLGYAAFGLGSSMTKAEVFCSSMSEDGVFICKNF
jgi:hypothetical protein